MDNYLKALLFLTVWREARGEGDEGMRAVAFVIRNRVRAWKKDWDDVIAGRNQFSSISLKGDSQLIVWPDDDDIKAKQVWLMCERVFDGVDNDDPTNGALYYYNPKTATSGWFVDNIVKNSKEHPVLANVGRHTFFA